MTTSAILPARGLADRLTALFWRHPRVLLALLLTPPLLWLGVVYLGSLAALLLQSFYSIDEFSGVVKEEFTLKTYGELLRPSNFDILVRTVTMAAAVTLACAILAFPIAYFAARYARGPWKAATKPPAIQTPRNATKSVGWFEQRTMTGSCSIEPSFAT